MKQLFTLFLIMLFLSGCSISKKMSGFSSNKIIFGYGGGFSGAQTIFTLDNTGRIVKQNNLTGNQTTITRLSKKETKKIYRDFLKLGLDTLKFAHPGNLSKFVGFKNQNEEQKIVWNDQNQPPDEIKTFYHQLIQKVTNQ